MSHRETIPLRLAKLSQLVDGKVPANAWNSLVSKDGLLDSLIALYEECERRNAQHKSNPPKHISTFLHRAASTVADIRGLRVNVKDFETVKLIGQGHFGQVKVVKEKSTGEIYALKIIRKKDVLSHQEAAYFEEERDIMFKSNNAWLTQLQYAFQDDINLYFAMDFHPGGDLSIVLSRYEALTESMARFYIAEMALAIHAVHTMGYIHRDIKPDNFLVDRVGHLKLTDFGSAAKMNEQGKVSGKMPVGTPDYIAPELLTSMTSSSDKPYNRLVDWWSLGIIVYEMICGHLPFSDESTGVVSTYSNIMKYKEKLDFPSSVVLTATAKQFITGLITDCKYRMGFDQITAHKFLSDLDLPNIRNSTPPYIPKVTSTEDTSNFDEVEARQHSPRDDLDQPELKDLPFVGFTSYRNLALLKAKQSTSSTSSSSASALVDMLLSPQVGDHESCNRLELQQYERKEASLRKELEKMRTTLKQKDSYINKLESAKDSQDRELSYLLATNNDLADQNKKLASNLETTRQVYEKVLGETEDFMAVLHNREKDQTEYEVTMGQELDNLKSELERMDGVIVEKDVKLVALGKKLERMESERSILRSQIDTEKQRADRASHQLSNYHKSDRKGTLVVKCEIETQHSQSEERVHQLQDELDKVLASNRSSRDLMDRLKEEKEQLEQELGAIKAISSRREADRKTEAQRHTLLDTEKMKLSRLEVRNAQLTSEITEKSQQTQQLANKISELTDQIEDAQRRLDSEREARMSIERSLRDRITELESRLSSASRDAQKLRTESHSVSDSEPKNRRIVAEQEQTIQILEANVQKLEGLVCGMRDGFDEKEQRRDQRGRQETRRWAEIVGELKQENMYLERKIEHLNTQLQAKVDYEDTYKTRLQKARDELHEMKTKTECEIHELNKRVLEAEVKMTDAKSEASSKAQSERILRRRVENLQTQLKEKDNLHEQRLQDIQNEKQTLHDQIEILKEETQIIDELEAEVTRLAQKSATLESENKSMREQTRRAVEAKTEANIKLDRLESEKKTTDRKCDSVNEELRRLKLVCNEMELNTQDLECLVDEYEKNNEQHSTERKELENSVTRLQNKTERLEASLQAERNQRQSVDERNERTKQTLQNQIISLRGKEENLLKELSQQRNSIDRLRRQVQQHEHEIGGLDKEKRSIKVRLSQAEEEIRKLKEEATTWRTQVTNLKASNNKLTTDIEMIMDKLDEIQEMKNAVENSMENLVLTKEHDQFKSEQILSQQTKLIDFLQSKYEAPMKKKKSGSKLFAQKRKDAHRHEFTQALDSERNRNRKLQEEVKDLKSELYQTKVSTTLKGVRDLSSLQSTPQSNAPRPEPDGNSAPSQGACSKPTASHTPTPSRRTKTEDVPKTMKHNIPHRLSVGLNTRAAKCGVCQSSVMFGKQAAKCQECHVVTHEKCKSDLPSTCGLPTQFMQLYTQTMERRNVNSAGGFQEADLQLVELGGWMKVRGLEGSTAGWERRFVLLENQALSFYITDDDVMSQEPIDTFNLRPLSRSTTVNLICDINPAELRHVSSDDLPYIVKLESQSSRSHGTSRAIYLLTANFTEKDKWESTLEAIVSRGCMTEDQTDTKLMGNRLIQLAGDSNVDVNCTTLLGENDILLIGAEEGLYACQLSYTSEPLIHIEGIAAVYQMSSVSIPDKLVIITGRKRWLSVTSYSSLRTKLLNSHNAISGAVTIQTECIGDEISGCTMFTTSEVTGRCVIVAATQQYISVIHYSNSRQTFSTVQEVDISEPCSCICYMPDYVLFGTDTIYKLAVHTGVIRPFLASGVKGSTSYNSLPIDILCVREETSRGDNNAEFIACFTDVGIFVDSSGHKTRQEEIQWSGLPLSFAYRAPYLYVIYYKAMQVIGPLDNTNVSWKSLQTFLNIQSPRYLGPAYTDGAVYVASLLNKITDIVVFKGNMQLPPYQVGDTDSQSDTQSESGSISSTASSSDYMTHEKRSYEFYQRSSSDKENSARSSPSVGSARAARGHTSSSSKGYTPTMADRYHAAVYRTGVTAKIARNIQKSDSSSASSVSSEATPTKPRQPLNSDYYNQMYGASKKKHTTPSTPHHSNV